MTEENKMPFRVVNMDEHYIIVMGNQKACTKEFETREEAENEFKHINWELIMTAVYGMIELFINQQKQIS